MRIVLQHNILTRLYEFIVRIYNILLYTRGSAYGYVCTMVRANKIRVIVSVCIINRLFNKIPETYLCVDLSGRKNKKKNGYYINIMRIYFFCNTKRGTYVVGGDVKCNSGTYTCIQLVRLSSNTVIKCNN